MNAMFIFAQEQISLYCPGVTAISVAFIFSITAITPGYFSEVHICLPCKPNQACHGVYGYLCRNLLFNQKKIS